MTTMMMPSLIQRLDWRASAQRCQMESADSEHIHQSSCRSRCGGGGGLIRMCSDLVSDSSDR